jgi:protein-S-isoprenylcysteine O-methyltransferase Ste14
MERYSDPFEDFDLHRDNPAIAVRPPCIALAFLAVGLAIDQFTSAPFLYEPVQYLGGAGLLIAGVGLAASAMRRFRAAGTAVETSRPSVTIVSDRPYAGTRNPIYVAMLLIYAGIVVVANAPAVVALMPVLFAVLHFGVGLREEDYLECKFGDAYLAYKLAVPRWL